MKRGLSMSLEGKALDLAIIAMALLLGVFIWLG
jgi:hypothetical protein